jgi:cullin-associated NEDD8-dissociated protein 1
LTRLSEKPGNIVSAVDTLLKNSVNDNEEQRDIATLGMSTNTSLEPHIGLIQTSLSALKSMLLELRSTNSVVTEVSEKVIQGTCKQLQNVSHSPVISIINLADDCGHQSEINTQHAVELLDILSLIFTQYSAQVAAKPALQATSLSVLLGLLASPRMHIRKRAIVALGSLAPTANREVFRTLSDRLIGVLGEGGDSIEIDEEEGVSGTEKQTAYVALVGTLGKAVPSKIGKVLDKLLPGILSLANETGEDVDSSEASMTASFAD